MREGFFTLHRDLPREGPGLPADVLWGLAVAGTPDAARICDAACGPGVDLVTLVAARPGAEVVGIDRQEHFISAARAWLPERVRLEQGDMAALPGVFDLIWCAGAPYFLGLTAGLLGWRGQLAKGGRVVFSEPVFVREPVSQRVQAFWQDDPCVTAIGGIRQRVAAAGYRILGGRLIIGAAWDAYYRPMAVRIAALGAGKVTTGLAVVLAEAAHEVALWRSTPEEIANAMFVVKPDD